MTDPVTGQGRSMKPTVSRQAKLDDALNESPLFGCDLSKPVESRILEYLDLKSLAACRLVDRRWRIAVDSLSTVWLGLTRRLGIADACEGGRERWRVQRMLGDCWITCSFCPIIKNSDASLSDLKLSWVRIDQTLGLLRITAFDPSRSAYHTWRLQLKTIQDRVNGCLENASQLHSEWMSLLKLEDCAEGTHKCTSVHQDDTDSSRDAEELEDSTDSASMVEAAKEDVGSDTGVKYSGVCNAEADSSSIGSIECIISRADKVPRLQSQRSAVSAHQRPNRTAEAALHALVPLRKSPTGSVVPLALIWIFNNESAIRMVVHRCCSCLQTQVLLLTTKRLMLYSLPASTVDEAAATRPNVSAPCASILFPRNQEAGQENVSHPYYISAIDRVSNADYHSVEYYVVYQYLCSASDHLLQLFRVNCRDLQQLNSVHISNSFIYRAVNDYSSNFIISRKLGTDPKTRGKVRIVRPFVSQEDCLDLDYGPCEYQNPIQTIRGRPRFDFGTGRQFWYCIGTTRGSHVALAIFRIGCPQPMSVVELGDLMPLKSLGESNFETAFLASNWIDRGFDPESAERTPLVSMRWRDDLHLLLEWTFRPPKAPQSARCARVRMSRDCLQDWPWLRWRHMTD